MSIQEATHVSESGHWYDRSGTQVAAVKGVSGDMVKPDLRHARKFGFVPGVTTVIKSADREGLTIYRERSVLMAALTLPRLDGEADEAYCARVMADSKRSAAEAAKQGSSLHARVEMGLNDPTSDDPWVLAVRNALADMTDMSGGWQVETPCVHRYGFGTKSDLNNRAANLVVDIKTKEAGLDKVKLYPEHWQQLAATRAALGMDDANCAILFLSRNEPTATTILASQVDLSHGWDTFKSLLNYWQTKNKCRPSWADKIYGETV